MAGARQDYAFPFQINGASQQTAEASYAAHVDQMVRQVLLTSPGERVNLPQFGCGLRSLVFAPDSETLAATVKLRVIHGLDQWLSGVVTVADVAVGSAAEPGTLEVTVRYTLVETQASQDVTVTVR